MSSSTGIKPAITATNDLDNAPMGKEHYKFIGLLAFAYAFDQMDLFTFSFVAPALTKYWGVSMEWIGMVNSCTFVGMLFGCWFGGWLSDAIGRKKTFLVSVLIFSISSVANGLAPNKEFFLIARTITGFGILSMVVVAMVYIVEILPAHSRGKYQAIALATGLLSIPVLGYLAQLIIPSSPDGWRHIFFISGSGLLVLFLGHRWLRESPRWLIAQGRHEEAAKVIKAFVPAMKSDFRAAMDLQEPLASQAERKRTGLSIIKELFGQKLIKKTSLLVSMVSCFTVGYFMFFAWMPTLLNEHGFSLEDSLWMATLVSFGSPIGNYLAALVADKGGRRIPIVIYSGVVGVLTVIFGVIQSPQWLVFIGFIVRVLMDGVFVLMWSYLAEAYPTPIRNRGTGIIYSIGRIFTAGAMLLVPLIFKEFGYSVLFSFIGFLFLFVAVTTQIWGEKTSGRSLEKISG